MNTELYFLLFASQIGMAVYILLLDKTKWLNKNIAISFFLSAFVCFIEFKISIESSFDTVKTLTSFHTSTAILILYFLNIGAIFYADLYKSKPRQDLLRKTTIWILTLFMLPIFYIAFFENVLIDVLPEKVNDLWTYKFTPSTAAHFYFIIWYLVNLSFLNVILFIAYRNGVTQRERRVRIILWLVFTVVPFSMLCHFIIFANDSGGMAGATYEISLVYGLLIFCLSWFFTKFKMFAINPADVVDELLSSISNGVVITDIEYNIEHYNHLATKNLNIHDNNLQTNFINYLHQHAAFNLNDVKNKLDRLKPGVLFKKELKITTSKGIKECMLIASKVVNKQNIKTGYTFVGVDLSELKTKEYQLEEFNQKLIKSNAQLERFAQITSHDLKTPLRNVISYLKLLRKKSEESLDKQSKEFLKIATNCATEMDDFIEDILAYSRLKNTESNEIETDLNKVVKDVLKKLKMVIEERKAIVELNPLPTIKAERYQMVQLFQNIIENGIKYNKSEIPTIKISSKLNDNRLHIFVSDNGIGVPEESQKDIFKLYNRLHTADEFKGTGIGLATCKQIVENHNGEISVTSNPDQGSTFIIVLDNFSEIAIDPGTDQSINVAS